MHCRKGHLRKIMKTANDQQQADVSSWPGTSDKEFSKRVCKAFMKAFFLHTFLTLSCIVLFSDLADSLTIFFETSLPVYMVVFGAVIAKSGVENVFKGKACTNAIKEEQGNG